jgi:ribosome-binding protein aMBF1 (putative translation factor)
MQGDNEDYVSVWETWELVSTAATHAIDVDLLATPTESSTTTDVGGVQEGQRLRERVQRARIEQRMSIAALAMNVTTTSEVLAAFERGDGILDSDLQKRVTRFLKLQ